MEFKRIVDKGSNRVPTIEVDKYEPHPEKQGWVRHVGMRTYGEVFRDLESHLEEMGMIPDEYFNSSYSLHHKDNEDLPDFSEALCNVNFGSNEGIYLDIVLASYGQDGPEFVRFATGKTLSRDVEAFYKMSMICAECSMMLNGRGCSVGLGQKDFKIEFNRVEREVVQDKSVDSIIADATAVSEQQGSFGKDDIELVKE